MTDVKDALNEYMSDPRYKAIEDELTRYTTDLYAAFDKQVFVGVDVNNRVKAHYCYGQGGFFKIELEPGTAYDLIPSAFNDAIKQYSVAEAKVRQTLAVKQAELQDAMVKLAYDMADEKAVSAKAPTTPTAFTPPKKKEYLN